MRHIKEKFYKQRAHAKRRGIDFLLSFDEWFEWWGADIGKRGRGAGKLQMCRFNDSGPYSLENIYKGTHEDNSKLKFKLGFIGRKRSLSDYEVSVVNDKLLAGESTRCIAKDIGVSQKTIMRVKHNEYN